MYRIESNKLLASGRVFLALAWMILLPAGDTLSATGSLPVTYGSINRDYARITFEWPETVYFTAHAEGQTLTITFDREANPNFGPMLKKLSPYVTKAQRKADGKTIVLTLNRPYRIRTFVSDNLNGIDLLEIRAKDQKKAAPAPAPAPVVEKKPAPASAPVASAEQLAALAPAAGEAAPEPAPAAEAAAKPVVLDTPAPAPVETAAPATPAAPAATPPAATAAAPAPAAATPAAPAAPNDQNDSVALAKGGPKPAVALPGDKLKINVSAEMDNAVLRFPFTERVAMAVFIRTHTLWIVIHKPIPIDFSDFNSLPRTVIGKPELLANDHATIIRMPINDGVYGSVVQEDNSFNWALLLTPKKRNLPDPLRMSVNTDPPAPSHIFIPSLENTEPITVDDPLIGDQLVITPLFKPGQGIEQTREFVEFGLLETSQGIVVNKKADDVEVVQLRNGLRITLPNGSSLTPGLPDVSQKATAASLNVVTLFPYGYWKSEDQPRIRQQLRELFRRVVDTENTQEANSARLRLAQLYLSEGMAAEAMAQLDGINRTNPAYYRSAKLGAMRGAANFLMYRFGEAARDFASPELNDNKEVDYWRAMLADLLGSATENYDYIELNQDYISKYPPIFRQRLAIVAADRSIAAKEYNEALKIFDTLQEDGLLEPINHYVNFLMAKVASDTGQEKDALDSWNKLAEDHKHPFVQARAEFSRIVWEMDHGTLPKEQAADRLERLRLLWHGDSLELQVLTLLGDIYGERKDYINAMRIWNGGVISFPNTATAIEMARHMQEAFIIMFNEGASDTLPTLDALALYYEYRNYAPAGSTGNAMMERLADRLLGMDLLDQAAQLLDHQMRFQAEKEQRSRLGAKLATVYLLNHNPRKALAVLQDSMYGENALMLRLMRNRLTAQSMAELGQTDKALQTLGQDDSPEAERIRLGVYWRQKDWPKVITSVEAMLKTRKEATAPITLEESEYLLELALAYVFQNDPMQLTYLHDYFGPLMENNPNKPVFDFVTSGDMQLTTTNFDDVVKHLSDTRTFIDNYNARIQLKSM